MPAAVIWIALRRRYACRYRTSSPALRFPEPHGAKQSSPLMPTKAKNTEQATGDCSGLRNDRAIYLDVIELELEIAAIGLSTGEQQPQDERVYV